MKKVWKRFAKNLAKTIEKYKKTVKINRSIGCVNGFGAAILFLQEVFIAAEPLSFYATELG